MCKGQQVSLGCRGERGDEIGRIRQLILSETRAVAVTQDNKERHRDFEP